MDDATPVRFVHVGGTSGEENIELPGVALRKSILVCVRGRQLSYAHQKFNQFRLTRTMKNMLSRAS
jgi:hypothetical protein